MSRKIIVADDSESVRQMIRFSLKQANYEVTEARNGSEALKKIRDTHTDMLITDLDMPGMNGIELIRNVRAISGYQSLPILILTAKSDTLIKQKAKAAGADGWITKPFRPAQLLAVVDKLLINKGC
ncbi:response regulator [Desulfonema magnum]|uniref:Two component system response regulator n=1 Tax=Desulfonema magnum TaxID=45655 RepID=A0A975BVD1_9BACT|nr:response regulator [Desulfonema magnum]QTA92510.1 Two component system response regulator [Desulfonema magnum]